METVETGDKYLGVKNVMHRKTLREDQCERCRAFPERVGPRILLLESVNYFGASEYPSGRKKDES